jgi:hypothetical protein
VHNPRLKKGRSIGCGFGRLLGFKRLLVILLFSTIHIFLAQNVHGGAEYVYVQKTMNDKAIIVRFNGYAYLIEKGVGCLSLWRYEGKTILINSPGIFLGVGSELLIPDLGQKCRIWNSQFLGAIKTPSSPPSNEHSKPPPKVDCTDKHWIQSKSNDGSIIILEDMSVWKVDAINRVDSMLWLPTEEVIVCSGEMINLNNGAKVGVTKLK